MIGLVIVSHSARLADGVRELVEAIAPGRLAIAVAGGTGDADHPIGTDAFAVQEAIESVYSPDGVLVLMDLGSAVLSAETALEFLDDDKRANVRLCAAPLVEGAVAAASRALAGAGLAEVADEAMAALAAKLAHLQGPEATAQAIPTPSSAEPSLEAVLTLPNALGLHLRPAAQLVQTAAAFDATITVRNASTGAGPAPATGISRLLGLAARQGQQIAVSAQGPQARQALDALSALITSGFGEDAAGSVAPRASAPVPAAPVETTPGRLAGIPAAPGIAIGPLAWLRPALIHVEEQHVADARAEEQRLLLALGAARTEIQQLRSWAAGHVGKQEAGIFEAHLLFLDDPSLLDAARERIQNGHTSAAFAWQSAVEAWRDQLMALEDPYMQARAADVADVGQRVLRHMAGVTLPGFDLPQPAIVAAHDLTPSEVERLDPQRVLGLCLEAGSSTAHSVILARAMGLPVVAGLGAGLQVLADGVQVALDGEQGLLWIEPGAATVRDLAARRAQCLEAQQAAQAARLAPATTRDRKRVSVFANINSLADVQAAVESGAEGVGLLRTEFLFARRDTAPSEDEQQAVYASVAAAFGRQPVIIRTLDIGGDKPLPYVPIGQEANPFLGLRGLRVSLDQPGLLKSQLRAILRASPGHNIEIMFPMVSTVQEVRAARALLKAVQDELRTEGVALDEHLAVGIMVEVPAAAASADQLAAEVDFFSIGSNDLSQYIMAADRGNPRVAALADAWQPAVLRTIHSVAQAGRFAKVRVGLCGELAADPLAAPLLVGMGLDELSANPHAVPGVKRMISRFSSAEAEAAVAQALALDSGDKIRALLRRRFSA